MIKTSLPECTKSISNKKFFFQIIQIEWNYWKEINQSIKYKHIRESKHDLLGLKQKVTSWVQYYLWQGMGWILNLYQVCCHERSVAALEQLNTTTWTQKTICNWDSDTLANYFNKSMKYLKFQQLVSHYFLMVVHSVGTCLSSTRTILLATSGSQSFSDLNCWLAMWISDSQREQLTNVQISVRQTHHPWRRYRQGGGRRTGRQSRRRTSVWHVVIPVICTHHTLFNYNLLEVSQ